MLKDAIKLIKLLWMKDCVMFQGKYYQVKDSNLYTKLLQTIPIYIAALGPQSARPTNQEADSIGTNELNPQLIESSYMHSEVEQRNQWNPKRLKRCCLYLYLL